MQYLKIAAYGPWSSRKTQQAGTLIRAYGRDNVLIVNADDGIGPIASQVNPELVFSADNMDDMRSAYAKVTKALKERNGDAWVVLDGMTRATNWIADNTISAANEYATQIALGKPHEAMDTRLKPYRRFISSGGAIDIMSIYGQIGTESKLFIEGWLRLPCNIYATYLEDMTSYDRKKAPPYVPDVPGQVGLKKVMSSFDFVYRHTYDDKGNLLVQLDPTKKDYYLSRTREDQSITGPLPKEIRDFDLANFVELLRGNSK